MNAYPQRRLHHSVATLVLVLAFLALPAGASARNWSFLSPWSLPSALWEALGSVFDPDGRPSDIGIEADPGGHTEPRMVFGNYGAVVDPSGQPAANPDPQDIGTVADPGGQPNH